MRSVPLATNFLIVSPDIQLSCKAELLNVTAKREILKTDTRLSCWGRNVI
jgi:hypothetical protein